MKKVILFVLLVLLSNYTFAQLNQMVVEYDCIYSMKQKMPGNDSISIVSNIDTLNTPIPIPKFISMNIVLMSVTTTGTISSSTIINKNKNTGWKNNDQIDQPDSTVYLNKQWIQYQKKEPSPMNITELKISYSKEEKEILGYRCIRADFYSEVDSTSGVIWIAPTLPATLMPFGGYNLFNGAVLECTFVNSGISYKAKLIKRI